MGIAITLQQFFDQNGVDYEVVKHTHTESSMESAEAAHVPGDRVAKSVVLEDGGRFLVAVLPATHRVSFGALHDCLNRDVGLAAESELRELFKDCEPGAIPPLGSAYGMETLVDASLLNAPEIYFEAGDHRELIHMSGEQFRDLMREAQIERFSSHI